MGQLQKNGENVIKCKINSRAEELTVVFAESASDWPDVPFDIWPPKQIKESDKIQHQAGRDSSKF